MPGKILKVRVEEGDKVGKGKHLLVTEAMKTETTVQAPADGRIKVLHLKAGDMIDAGDWLLESE